MAMMLDGNALTRLREFGDANVISLEEFWKIYKKEAPVAGDREGHRLFIPTKYRLVYSVEWTPSTDLSKCFLLKRMSISVLKTAQQPEQRWVNFVALDEILKGLGFKPLSSGELMIDKNDHDEIPNICVSQLLETKETKK
jgi:hypothetical protein